MTGVLRSEWTKLRSVRSTLWTLLTAVALMVGFGVLLTAVSKDMGEEVGPADALMFSLSGSPFASLAVASLGVLVISGEYRTGMIRTTLLAVPGRLRMLAAKVAVFTAVALTVSLVASFAAFLAGQAVLGDAGIALGDPGALRAVVGSALLITASGIFGLALGALIRHTPGATVAAIALIFVLPQMTNMLPGAWGEAVREHFTTNAGDQVTRIDIMDGQLGPWTGFGVYCAWIAVALAAAAVLLRRRDA
ncbi:ABC transporter permease [Planomonospora parontospora subsp. antibiotica]|uniref:ABC transporter permease n=1 Tax=Planomonospora parontospora TaxID=58119 RepID=UPI00167061E2|nr:ABC transporter permease subunit [Planomonospora parontospora]GGL36452.1 ABC transporter permease [Planomonospora parontospora subsp. antibiotica]GII17364.1 ABC transporter permease [Planomonospora parontospora subsp. antibiotica]